MPHQVRNVTFSAESLVVDPGLGLRLTRLAACSARSAQPCSRKNAEVTVPSLNDWEKQWKKNPQSSESVRASGGAGEK